MNVIRAKIGVKKHIFLVIIDGGSKPIVSSRLDPRVETLIGNNLVSVQHPCFIGDYNKNKIGMFQYVDVDVDVKAIYSD